MKMGEIMKLLKSILLPAIVIGPFVLGAAVVFLIYHAYDKI